MNNQAAIQGFDHNPFQAIMSRMQQPQQQPQAQQGMPAQDTPEGMPENQLMKGKNPDNTQNLIGAVKALQAYIASSTDPTEIAMARSIVSLLSKLIDKDQQKMASNLPQDHQVMQVMGPQQ